MHTPRSALVPACATTTIRGSSSFGRVPLGRPLNHGEPLEVSGVLRRTAAAAEADGEAATGAGAAGRGRGGGFGGAEVEEQATREGGGGAEAGEEGSAGADGVGGRRARGLD